MEKHGKFSFPSLVCHLFKIVQLRCINAKAFTRKKNDCERNNIIKDLASQTPSKI